MAGRDLISLLRYEVKRNDHIKSLYDQLPDLSSEQIDNLEVKPWIKKAFKKSKEISYSQIISDEQEARIIANTRFEFVADPIGLLCRYTGFTKYITLDRGALEIKEGSLFWVASNGVWFGTTYSRFFDRNISYQAIRDVKKTEYMIEYRNSINGSYNGLTVPETVVYSEVKSDTLSIHSIKVQKY